MGIESIHSADIVEGHWGFPIRVKLLLLRRCPSQHANLVFAAFGPEHLTLLQFLRNQN